MPQTLSQMKPLPDLEMVPTYAELLAQNATLLEQVHQMRAEIQALRDDLARLKKQPPKPTIRPSKLTEKEKQRQKRRKAKKKGPRRVDEMKVVKAENEKIAAIDFATAAESTTQ